MIKLKRGITPTNGDSIRSMDNETLALWLSLMMRGRGCTKENISLQNTLDWLQQPVKEDVESLVSPFQKHHELFYTEK